MGLQRETKKQAVAHKSKTAQNGEEEGKEVEEKEEESSCQTKAVANRYTL